MSWINKAVRSLLVIFITIIVVDLVALGFKNQIRRLFPDYAVDLRTLARDYPLNYFKPDSELGFDNNPNFKTKTSLHPEEYGRYEI